MTVEQMAARLHEAQRKLYMIARAMMRSEHDALDMVQETAYRACKTAGRLRNLESADDYLAQILVNCRRTQLRRCRRESLTPELDAASVPDEVSDVDLRQMVESLPEALRVPVLLKYYGDLSQVEIARALRMPESTVRHRLQRALALMRMQLEDDE